MRKMSESAIEKMLRINADKPFAAEIAAVLLPIAKKSKPRSTTPMPSATV